MKTSLDDLIAGMYDAALDASLWPAVLDAATHHLQASHAVVYTPLVAPDVGGFFYSHNVTPERLQAYEVRYRPMDLWTLGYQRHYAGREGGFTGDMFVPFDALVRSEFYNDFLRPQELHHLCTCVVKERSRAGDLVSFAMFRGPRHKPFEERDRLISQRLTSHLQRALMISDRLNSCERRRRIDAAMLDTAATAIFLVDRSAKVLRLTEAAEGLVRKSVHVQLRLNRLCAVDDDTRLGDVIREVASSHVRAPFSRILAIAARNTSDRLHLLIVKAGMHLQGHAYVIAGPLATSSAARLARHLQFEYCLTPAEIRLCSLLKDGYSLNDVAEKLSLRRSTVVTQVKAVFSKTATNRQSELMKLLIDLSGL